MAFNLSLYPNVYKAKYNDGSWTEEYDVKPHKTPAEEASMSADDLNELLRSRNSFPELPLVNYTSQYGLGCFEGLKAFPQKDGSLKIFRPDENAKRMRSSMEGLKMPGYPEDLFVNAVIDVTKRNQKMGFAPTYDASWEKDNFLPGHAVYIRPFSYAEGGIGLGLSSAPWVVVISTPVGAYFSAENTSAVTTNRVRATKNGTGWIKCAANYVIPTLAKKQANADGYMEAIFLDAIEQKYVEEGSSCNIFFYLKDGTLVTPELGDTILPGITRKSIITLARDKGLTVTERKIAIEEVMSEAKEVFVTGTAAGVSHFQSITHNGKTVNFGNGKMGELTTDLLLTLKGIQYGAIDDKFNWMYEVK